MSGIFEHRNGAQESGHGPARLDHRDDGSGCATRCRPAPPQAREAKTNLYGYLVATVSPGGSIQFDFQEILEKDVPESVSKRFSPELVHWCFTANIRAAH